MDVDVITNKYGTPPKTHKKLPVQAVANPGHVIEVVGEYYRKRSVEAAIDKTGGYGWAVLVPEPDNKHDRNAISVWVGSLKIGFIEAALAKRMQPVLLDLRHKCGQALACPVEFEDNWAEQETSQAFLILDSAAVIGASASTRVSSDPRYDPLLPPPPERQPVLITIASAISEHRKHILILIAMVIGIVILRRVAQDVGDFIRIMF